MKFLIVLLPIFALTKAYPSGAGLQAAASLDAGGAPPLISFDKGGNVGVNFLGYHASAGLGGLLSGDWTRGGLHASAGTPHGQFAGAGLGGGIGGTGKAAGGLFAGATAGGGVGAAAGLGGGVGGPTAVHTRGGFGIETEGNFKGDGKAVVVEEKHLNGPPQVHRTVIEKTVIPNYVEKKVQETHYVEKTVKVPEVVEKTVRVAAPPTVIEKTYDVPSRHGGIGAAGVNVQASAAAAPSSVGVVKYGSTGGAYGSGSSGGLYASGGFAGTGGGHGKGSLFTDIFNIPISTLGAVSNLLNGILGGGAGGGAHASGSFAASKSYATAGAY